MTCEPFQSLQNRDKSSNYFPEHYYLDSYEYQQGVSSNFFVPVVRFVTRYSIDLQIDWIPRSFNDHTNAISRIIDFDDLGVSLEFFNYIDHIWGPILWIALPISITTSSPASIPVFGTQTQRVWMLFVMTG